MTRPTDTITDHASLFLLGIDELSRRYDPTNIVTVMHATLKLHREMNAVVGMFAKAHRAQADGLVNTPLLIHYIKKRSQELRREYGDMAIEFCMTVFEEHATLKNEFESLLARLTLSRGEADAILGKRFPLVGYQWERMGARQL